MKHTQGKWILDEHYADVRDEKANLIMRKAPHGTTPFSKEEQVANARLIASAPELLEALKSTRILHLENYEEGTIGKKLYIEIEQAIAKAEGK